ncbi:S1C family serine protease [Streptomyces avermitilis]|uniref:S1C family serine protease n=1 Tax=Streptomyces avermitilis TaxID=33903 RepID=UPI003F53FE8B
MRRGSDLSDEVPTGATVPDATASGATAEAAHETSAAGDASAAAGPTSVDAEVAPVSAVSGVSPEVASAGVTDVSAGVAGAPAGTAGASAGVAGAPVGAADESAAAAHAAAGAARTTVEAEGEAVPAAAVPGTPGDVPGGVPVDRPTPLHDPDPYSTPPYGQPGPWAPAPPVQFPATTPAHGTPSPAPPGAAQAPVAPSGHPTPGAPGPTPGEPTPAAPSPAAPPASPWQNYDPWAATPAPLHQTGAAVASREQRRKRAIRVLVLGAVVLALVSGGIGGAVGVYLERTGGVTDVELPQAGQESEERAADSVAGIAARALPSVVTLHVKGSTGEGTGTGFVLDGRGHILTNNHVVEPAGSSGEISVTFSGGETAKATVVGRDSGYDLAVVKVSGVGGLKPMPLGNSDNVQVGDPVVAIGAPFDLANTVTSGIISAKERPITAGGEKGDGSDVSYVDALQTDAPINPGNSGGPLLDSKARVVGINSAIRSADSGSDQSGQAGSIGLGFAIPVNQAKRVAEELINTGRATHPVIGVTLDMNYTGDGARVGAKSDDGGSPVTRGGPGDRAGIRAGDVITEVDGQRIHSGEELIVKIRAHRPGDHLALTVERDGKEKPITLVLGSASGA